MPGGVGGGGCRQNWLKIQKSILDLLSSAISPAEENKPTNFVDVGSAVKNLLRNKKSNDNKTCMYMQKLRLRGREREDKNNCFCYFE